MSSENSRCTPVKIFKLGFVGGKSTLPISSDFGYRLDPHGSGKTKPHYGVDIAVPSGTPLYAPVDGVILTSTVQNKKAGLYIKMRYYDSNKIPYYVYFMHMNKSFVHAGQNVKAGDLIGNTGGIPSDQPNAGSSTGAHLHLEIRRGTTARAVGAVDPKWMFLIHHQLTIIPRGSVSFYNANMISSYQSDDTFCSEYCVNVDRQEVVDLDISIYPPEVEYTTDMSSTEVEPVKVKKIVKDADTRLALGIWQITKTLFDEDVQNKQICDSAIATTTGSLLNYFNKVCQKPFVEFMGDTYGNQYYWIVRRPPFDRHGYERMMNYAKTIDKQDIISQSIQWETNGIYSWYQILPTGDSMTSGKMNQFYAPAVLFPEYASIWGSKPLSIQSVYFDFVYSGLFNSDYKKDCADNADRIIKNVVSDFKFMIESNAYKPFSRCGSVTIRGCRKIKRVTMVIIGDEYFYVDSVSHNYSVSVGNITNTTTLKLSHGLFIDYIYDNDVNYNETIQYKKVSYFSLIDFGENFNIENVTASNYKDYIMKWKVNKEAFSFFISKVQLKM